MASVLLTVGELALVAGPSLRPHVGDLLPLIIDAVQDPADSLKRNVAVVTLGNVRVHRVLYCNLDRNSDPDDGLNIVQRTLTSNCRRRHPSNLLAVPQATCARCRNCFQFFACVSSAWV